MAEIAPPNQARAEQWVESPVVPMKYLHGDGSVTEPSKFGQEVLPPDANRAAAYAQQPAAATKYLYSDGSIYDGDGLYEMAQGGGSGGGGVAPSPAMINNVTLPFGVSRSSDQLGLATAAQGALADTAYQKPATGVPKSDLAADVQTSLGKADTALQSYTETDPTVPAWAKQSSKPSYTVGEISGAAALTDLTAHTGNTSNPHSTTLSQAATAQGTTPTILTGGLYNTTADPDNKYLTASEIAAQSTSGTVYKGQLKYGADTVVKMNTLQQLTSDNNHGLTVGDKCGVQETQLSYTWDGALWQANTQANDAIGDLYLINYWYGTHDGKTYAGEVQAQIRCVQVTPSIVFDLYLDTTILLDNSVTDDKIGNRTLTDSTASGTLVDIAAKTLTSWLQGIRNNLKWLRAQLPVPPISYGIVSGSTDINGNGELIKSVNFQSPTFYGTDYGWGFTKTFTVPSGAKITVSIRVWYLQHAADDTMISLVIDDIFDDFCGSTYVSNDISWNNYQIEDPVTHANVNADLGITWTKATKTLTFAQPVKVTLNTLGAPITISGEYIDGHGGTLGWREYNDLAQGVADLTTDASTQNAAFVSHISNTDVHVTATDKTTWSGKQDANVTLQDTASTQLAQTGVSIPLFGALQTFYDNIRSLLSYFTNGIANAAEKLSTARTISLTGNVTGSASFDGNADANIAATIAGGLKTIGSNSVIGSGDIAVKTVGAQSIFGTGDIPTAAPTTQTGSITINSPFVINMGYSLRKNGNIVTFSCNYTVSTSYSANTVLTTLPSGFRPAATLYYYVPSGGTDIAPQSVNFFSDGRVVLTNALTISGTKYFCLLATWVV